MEKKKQDNEVVQRIMAVLENWIDPFQYDEQLCHLASGIVATDEVKTDLLNAHAKGLDALGSFATERMVEDGKKTLMPLTQLSCRHCLRSIRKNVGLKPHKHQ